MPPARIWREQKRRYLNEIAVCRNCGHRHYPPRRVCEDCGSKDMEPATMAETGKVLTFTVTRAAPPDLAKDAPYAVAILQMDDGTRTMAQLADVNHDDVAIGMRVKLEFRKIRQDGKSGVISYGHKAVPLQPYDQA